MENFEKTLPTKEEMARIQKDRLLSDAKLVEGGAGYVFDEKGNGILVPTEEQIDEIDLERAREMASEKFMPEITASVQNLKEIIQSPGSIRLSEVQVEELRGLKKDLVESVAMIENIIRVGGANFKEKKELKNGWIEINNDGKKSLLKKNGELYKIHTNKGDNVIAFHDYYFIGGYIIVNVDGIDYLERIDQKPFTIQDSKYGPEIRNSYAWESGLGLTVDVSKYREFLKELVER